MLRVPLSKVNQQRTLRPLYAQHQATPHGGYLDPDWDRSVDIYPGMVMARKTREIFTLFTGTDPDERPYGLSALFVAPDLGIDETQLSGLNVFTVWRGGPDAMFEVLAPAFATSATWSNPTDGSRVTLVVTTSGHTDGPGKLAPQGEANTVDYPVGTLIEFVSSSKIIVNFDPMPQTASAVAWEDVP